MRNLTNEQAESIALGIVIDYLLDGIEYQTIVESVDDSLADDENEAEDDDYTAVQDEASGILESIRKRLESSNL